MYKLEVVHTNMKRIEDSDYVKDVYESDNNFTVEYEIELSEEDEYEEYTAYITYKITYWDEYEEKYITEENQKLELTEVSGLWRAEDVFLDWMENDYGYVRK